MLDALVDNQETRDMPYPSFRLDDQVALVTGASKGIGYGLALALADAGAHVVLTARGVPELENLAREIRAMGRRALVVPLDVTNPANINEAFQAVGQEFGRLDILVNNAGIGSNHPALEVTEANWDEMMSVNLKGLFFCCQAAAKLMLPRSSGRIINISSQASLVGIRDHAVYCASKGGVNQLTRVLALEWSELGVTVNAVAPTFIYTPGTAERLDQPEYLQGVLERLPIGRVGDINDVAAAVIYLASPAGGLVTGSTLSVDGGWTAQ
jgi:NAD(P)-dependent dehydrogenase (short-subunit alcohol dehydrogenase family)